MKKTILLLIAGLSSAHVYAEESRLNLALGSFDVRRSGTAMGQIEYAFATDWSGFKPHVGLLLPRTVPPIYMPESVINLILITNGR